MDQFSLFLWVLLCAIFIDGIWLFHQRFSWKKLQSVAARGIQAVRRGWAWGRVRLERLLARAQRAGVVFQRWERVGMCFEAAGIVAWAVWISRNLKFFDATQVPVGGEFGNLVQSHFIWTLVPRCGLCFLWNGFLNGGAPALVELSGAVLHPLVFLPVLAFGVVNGAKVTIAASLALAGLAQWTMGLKLKWSAPVRLWAGLLITAAGHLAGRLENGNLPLVVGMACAGWAATCAVDLLYNRNRRAVGWLAAAFTGVLLSGEGYNQVGLVLVYFPWVLGLVFVNQRGRFGAFGDLCKAGGLTVLLSGVWWVPLLHFAGQFDKGADVTLSNFQTVVYNPLNLVISDWSYYKQMVLGKDIAAYTHIHFLGWVPVILAIMALTVRAERQKRLVWALALGAAWAFWSTSLEFAQIAVRVVDQFVYLRHLSSATGFAIPLIVTLAGCAAQAVLKQKRVFVSLVLLAALGWSLTPVYTFSQNFFRTDSLPVTREQLAMFSTPSAQWVNPPYGRYDWTLAALERGMKIGDTWRAWFWRNHIGLAGYVEAYSPEAFPKDTHAVEWIGDAVYAARPEKTYAAITLPGVDPIGCDATSQGGWIDVTCPDHPEGALVVREYRWDGWRAWVDGAEVGLFENDFLTVPAPANSRVFRFRYLPVDVLIGAVITLFGLALTARRLIWRSAPPRGD